MVHLDLALSMLRIILLQIMWYAFYGPSSGSTFIENTVSRYLLYLTGNVRDILVKNNVVTGGTLVIGAGHVLTNFTIAGDSVTGRGLY